MESIQQVAQELLAALHQQLPSSGFRLDGIEVHLGELVDLPAEALAEFLRQGLPGVEVQITRIPALLRCLDCGAEYPPEEYPCPACGSGASEHAHGMELQIARAWGQTV